MNGTDSTLVRMTLTGNTNAFGELVKRHQDSVYGLALHWTRNPATAADLAQEAFVRSFHKLHQFRMDCEFRPWVLGICANLAKNRIRSESRRQAAEDAYAVSEPLPGATKSDSRTEAVRQALAKMDEQERLPLILKHIDGLSYESIADVLKIRLSAAKMRVKRARDELVRRMLSEQEVAG